MYIPMIYIGILTIVFSIMLSIIVFILLGIPTLPTYDPFDFFNNK